MVNSEEYYDPKGVRGVINSLGDDADVEDFTEDSGNEFVIKDYTGKHLKELKCKSCGATTFNVAQGSYHTAIRCMKCEYEVTIHDG